MNDSTATVRAEILEAKKQALDEQIDSLRDWRDQLQEYAEQERDPGEAGSWQRKIATTDAEIDRLLTEKDSLHLALPASPATQAQMRARLAAIMRKPKSSARNNALAALDNAIEAIDILADYEEANSTPSESRIVNHEIAALKKMRDEFLASDDTYLHQRADRIAEQIASLRGEATG